LESARKNRKGWPRTPRSNAVSLVLATLTRVIGSLRAVIPPLADVIGALRSVRSPLIGLIGALKKIWPRCGP